LIQILARYAAIGSGLHAQRDDYFDVETKRTILKKIRNCLLPHGYLFLGTAETTTNLDPLYQPVTMARLWCIVPTLIHPPLNHIAHMTLK